MIDFRVLGPLEVQAGDERIVLPGDRLRALLVALLLRPNTVVPAQRLVGALWAEDLPDDPGNALHQAVRRLRAQLGPLGGAVRTRAPGYLLVAEPSSIDAERFEQGAAAARRLAASDPAAALTLLEEALGLWRGAAYGEFAERFARAPAVRLEELRSAALEERAALQVECGLVTEAIAGARELVARQPLRTRPVEVLMRALDADGRRAEALDVYRRHRRLLADQLGLDPPETLRHLESRILRGTGDGGGNRRPVPAPPAPAAGRLPWRPGGLLGREQDLDLLRTCLQAQRLVTLVGPGGVGKTRLALEAAHDLAAEGRHVWWVDLSGVAAPRLVDALAEGTGTDGPGGPDPAGSLVSTLRAHRGVLCLDNAETVLAALAPLAERLLDGAPELTLVATSRERLGVAGEHVHLLAPLPLPVGADRDNPAVRLFVERAPGLEPGSLSDDDVDVIAGTCRRLDGLPLAIEIGAARAPTFGLREFALRLGQGLDLLTGGRRTAADRHRSVRAVLDWSHGLLTDDEARLFARLAVFPGAFTVDQVEAVCAAPPLSAAAVAPLLARLAEQSLVQAGGGRFWLLETLRSYAGERLEPADRQALRGRHAADVARRLTALTPSLSTADEAAGVAALAALSPDLHAAWAYAVDSDRDLALRLAADVHDYAYDRQRLDLLGWGLEVAGWDLAGPDASHPALADALACAAVAAWSAGRLQEAEELADRGLAAAGGPESAAAARVLNQCACLAMFTGRTGEAIALFDRAAGLYRASGEPVRALGCDVSVCQVVTYDGRAAAAARRVTDLLGPIRDSRNPSALSWAFFVLGEATAAEDPDRALEAYAAAIEHGTPVDDRLDVMLARSSVVGLMADGGPPARALEEFGRVMDQWEDLGNDASQWWVLLNLVVLLARIGSARDAALIAGAVVANRDRRPALLRDDRRLEGALRLAGQTLGDIATDAALAEGAGLSFAAAVAAGRRAISGARSSRTGGRED
jgi:predicted ATPase/DNA-binding SARP family transcriptional activator